MTESAIKAELAPHTHRVTLLIAIVGILIAIYSLWRIDNTRDRADATKDRVQQLELANNALRADLNTAIEQDAKARAELQKQWSQVADLPQQVKDLTASHDDLRARTERPQRAWSRAEALYLIELAQRRLSFDRDTETAIAALESADARLASLRDASFAAVRGRLAKDLQALRGVPVPDRPGVVAKLSAVESQIDRLKLKGVLVGERQTPIRTADSDSWWSRSWTSMTNTFANMFVVHRLKGDNGNVVSLEEQALRRQHLSLLAFTARHAVLRNDQTAYQAALNEMLNWLANYFGDSQEVDAVVRDLKTLREIDIAPPVPDISATAQMLMRSSSVAAP